MSAIRFKLLKILFLFVFMAIAAGLYWLVSASKSTDKIPDGGVFVKRENSLLIITGSEADEI